MWENIKAQSIYWELNIAKYIHEGKHQSIVHKLSNKNGKLVNRGKTSRLKAHIGNKKI